jgi:hypothetical protein
VKDSSFCEQKEAKKLHPMAPVVPGEAQADEVFLVLFFKKEPFL